MSVGAGVILRPARVGDAPGIARVHVESWKSTYAGQMPEEILRGLSVEKRLALWEGVLREIGEGSSPGKCLWVATDESDGIVGFSSAGQTRSGPSGFDSELYAIYLLERHQGRGLGARLFGETLRSLRGAGFRRMMLWVLESNAGTRRFYERRGGRLLEASKIETIAGHPLPHVAYGWEFA